jgi:hypothetical protein
MQKALVEFFVDSSWEPQDMADLAAALSRADWEVEGNQTLHRPGFGWEFSLLILLPINGALRAFDGETIISLLNGIKTVLTRHWARSPRHEAVLIEDASQDTTIHLTPDLPETAYDELAEGVRAGSFVADASYRWDADHLRWVVATVD